MIDVWFGYARTYIYAPKRTRPCNVFFIRREGGDHIFQRNEKNETNEERVNGVGSRPATNTSVGSLSS